ncbi:MAG: YkgJ family cysteine cluster protein [Verrucomicrobia bacterium]|nr:YkgJ family cysteine cluster protein [Verrucomicrobiota bacterium]
MSTIRYLCQRCTNCCRWPGFVRLTDADVVRISHYLGLSEFDFIQQYTVLRSDRQGLALRSGNTDDCIFLSGRDCVINPVKPAQCSGFPNEWNFPGWRDCCKAVEIGADEQKSGTGVPPVALKRKDGRDARPTLTRSPYDPSTEVARAGWYGWARMVARTTLLTWLTSCSMRRLS